MKKKNIPAAGFRPRLLAAAAAAAFLPLQSAPSLAQEWSASGSFVRSAGTVIAKTIPEGSTLKITEPSSANASIVMDGMHTGKAYALKLESNASLILDESFSASVSATIGSYLPKTEGHALVMGEGSSLTGLGALSLAAGTGMSTASPDQCKSFLLEASNATISLSGGLTAVSDAVGEINGILLDQNSSALFSDKAVSVSISQKKNFPNENVELFSTRNGSTLNVSGGMTLEANVKTGTNAGLNLSGNSTADFSGSPLSVSITGDSTTVTLVQADSSKLTVGSGMTLKATMLFGDNTTGLKLSNLSTADFSGKPVTVSVSADRGNPREAHVVQAVLADRSTLTVGSGMTLEADSRLNDITGLKLSNQSTAGFSGEPISVSVTAGSGSSTLVHADSSKLTVESGMTLKANSTSSKVTGLELSNRSTAGFSGEPITVSVTAGRGNSTLVHADSSTLTVESGMTLKANSAAVGNAGIVLENSSSAAFSGQPLAVSISATNSSNDTSTVLLRADRSTLDISGGLSLTAEAASDRVLGLTAANAGSVRLTGSAGTISVDSSNPTAQLAVGISASGGSRIRAETPVTADIRSVTAAPGGFSVGVYNTGSDIAFADSLSLSVSNTPANPDRGHSWTVGYLSSGGQDTLSGRNIGITAEDSGDNSLFGILSVGSRLEVSESAESFSATVKSPAAKRTTSVIALGAAKPRNAPGGSTVSIEAGKTVLSAEAHSEASGTENELLQQRMYTNAVYASASTVSIGGESATLSSQSTQHGGMTVHASKGGTVSLTSGKITVTSSASGSDDPSVLTAAYASNGSSIYINADESGNALSGTAVITGDLTAEDSSRVYAGLAGSSVLTGAAERGDEAAGDLRVLMSGSAVWNVTGSSSASLLLTEQGSRVYMGGTSALYRTLEPETAAGFTPVSLKADRLDGTGAAFYLRAAIDENAADSLYFGQAAGSHALYVRSVGAEPESLEMSQYLVHAESGDASFALGNPQGLVDAGVYVYALAEREAQSDSGTGSAREWYLKRSVRPDPDPETPDAPDPGTDEPALSPTAETVLIMHGAAAQTANYLGTLDDLRKRLGDVRSQGTAAGLWTSLAASKTRIKGYRGSSLKQESVRANLGADAMTAGGSWLLGGYLSVMTADQKARHDYGRLTGDAHGERIALYATRLFDSGAYIDAVAAADRYHQTMRTSMLDGRPVKGRENTWGWGFSLEAGHTLGIGTQERFFAEPQVQLAYYRAASTDYTLTNGFRVRQGGADSLTGRAGIVGGLRLKDASGAFAGDLYAKAGVLHEFLGSQFVTMNGEKFELSDLGTRWYYGIGGERWISRTAAGAGAKIYGQIERTEGSRFTADCSALIGLKLSF